MSDWEAARAHLGAASADNASTGPHSMAPVIRREYAEKLLARGAPGDAERARELLREALAGLAGASSTR
jgi:hypothetical protein